MSADFLLFGVAENLSWGRRGSEEEVEAMRNLQRQWLERDRNEQLAKLRAWLKRGGEKFKLGAFVKHGGNGPTHAFHSGNPLSIC